MESTSNIAGKLAAEEHPQLDVEFAEEDDEVSISDGGGDEMKDVQVDAPWHLDRIDQESLPLDGAYHFPKSAGTGADIYIVDTGVNPHHVDLYPRVIFEVSTSSSSPSLQDENGHGTHCAGTSAGRKYGVAKNATIVAVRSLNAAGKGPFSDVIHGLQWVANRVQQNRGRPAIVNLSVQGKASGTLTKAVVALANMGVHVTAAAGNSGEEACIHSPAIASKNSTVIAVGATDIHDDIGVYSNYGECVTILAPGSNVVSDYIGDNDSTKQLTGTSMASPQIAGVIANLIASERVDNDPKLVKQYLLEHASTDVISSSDGGSVEYAPFVYLN
ncbi:hypothetical protein SmJEL517_g01531 [Synchytrium microbalum]|uniref:Peptidase S8/S53 domain-containing protein n=1 Tax=Synchytrium microbalum TaxID=1806994 RepID=A0A507C9Q4_9FUNG|nr:uncharacterized protein SmJEL517_g01531 [Synchytrium microbalum]TPX36332.1 hypothetical protein SmJEL517_g01531 [Synchytrium microbalum]